MTVLRFTCQQCGLVTRVEQGQDHRACSCRAAFDCVNEDEEASNPAPPDEEPAP